MTAKSRGIMHSTGRRKPILMSGAGKAVGGILRRRPCSFLAGPILRPSLKPAVVMSAAHPRRLVICAPQQLLLNAALMSGAAASTFLARFGFKKSLEIHDSSAVLLRKLSWKFAWAGLPHG
jgi:hypothetical protein